MAEPQSPLSRPRAAEAEPCSCGGEGIRFLSSREGRMTAEACACTKACKQCEGQGRVYERDQRGYSVVRGCTCGADPRRLALLNGLQVPGKFSDRTLDGYKPYSPTQARALARARRFVDELVPDARELRAVCFFGPPGTGKTHLLAGMLRELSHRKGVRGRYEEFFLLLSDIRDGYARGMSSREWLEPLRTVDVLAIDEIGKGGKNREFEQGVLDEIISVRYNAGKPTLLATNYPRPGSTWKFGADGELNENLEQRVGARIYSRLHEMCDLVEVYGTDRRKDEHETREVRSGASSQPPPAGRAAPGPAAVARGRTAG
jgi:DNA replication protein DnaC